MIDVVNTLEELLANERAAYKVAELATKRFRDRIEQDGAARRHVSKLLKAFKENPSSESARAYATAFSELRAAETFTKDVIERERNAADEEWSVASAAVRQAYIATGKQ